MDKLKILVNKLIEIKTNFNYNHKKDADSWRKTMEVLLSGWKVKGWADDVV